MYIYIGVKGPFMQCLHCMPHIVRSEHKLRKRLLVLLEKIQVIAMNLVAPLLLLSMEHE